MTFAQIAVKHFPEADHRAAQCEAACKEAVQQVVAALRQRSYVMHHGNGETEQAITVADLEAVCADWVGAQK